MKLKIKSFSTITSHGSIGGYPEYFTVQTKDGNYMEFGNTANSRFMTDDNATVMFWRINRLQDKNGNYIDFIYDNANRESLITEIKFTGNATASLLPYNSVLFHYNTRFDDNTIYDLGNTIKSTKLLERIEVKAGTSIFKEYRLGYSKGDLYSYLQEVAVTGINGSSELNSTIFKYGENVDLVTTDTKQLGLNPYSVAEKDVLLSGDVDGDGETELIRAVMVGIQGPGADEPHIGLYDIFKKNSSGQYLFDHSYAPSANGTFKVGGRNKKSYSFSIFSRF